MNPHAVDQEGRTVARASRRHVSPGATAPPARCILIVNDSPERLDGLSALVGELGHGAVVSGPSAFDVENACERLTPDCVLVGRRGNDDVALALIASIAHEASLPVIATLPQRDRAYIHKAADCGAFGCVIGLNADELEAAIEIAVQRYSQYHGLQDAFSRRAVVEQAKGILMARRAIDPDAAFDVLRRHARRSSRKVVDVAEAVISAHGLLD